VIKREAGIAQSVLWLAYRLNRDEWQSSSRQLRNFPLIHKIYVGWALLWDKVGGGMKPMTHFNLVPRLRMSGAMPHSTMSFRVVHRNNFTFIPINKLWIKKTHVTPTNALFYICSYHLLHGCYTFRRYMTPSSGSWHQSFYKTYSNKIDHNKHTYVLVSKVQNITGYNNNNNNNNKHCQRINDVNLRTNNVKVKNAQQEGVMHHYK
jgi:hypothetical protein